jgi:hypothetical protein
MRQHSTCTKHTQRHTHTHLLRNLVYAYELALLYLQACFLLEEYQQLSFNT